MYYLDKLDECAEKRHATGVTLYRKSNSLDVRDINTTHATSSLPSRANICSSLICIQGECTLLNLNSLGSLPSIICLRMETNEATRILNGAGSSYKMKRNIDARWSDAEGDPDWREIKIQGAKHTLFDAWIGVTKTKNIIDVYCN